MTKRARHLLRIDQRLLSGLLDQQAWWALAVQYPERALASPMFDLMVLEDPGAWQRLQRSHVHDWVNNALRWLSGKQAEQFAVDCLDHYAPLFEESASRWLSPDGLALVQEGREARRAFSRGEISKARWGQHKKTLGALQHQVQTAVDMQHRATRGYVLALSAPVRRVISYINGMVVYHRAWLREQERPIHELRSDAHIWMFERLRTHYTKER